MPRRVIRTHPAGHALLPPTAWRPAVSVTAITPPLASRPRSPGVRRSSPSAAHPEPPSAAPVPVAVAPDVARPGRAPPPLITVSWWCLADVASVDLTVPPTRVRVVVVAACSAIALGTGRGHGQGCRQHRNHQDFRFHLCLLASLTPPEGTAFRSFRLIPCHGRIEQAP